MKPVQVLALMGIAGVLALAAGDGGKVTAAGDPAALPNGGIATLWLLDGQANDMSLNTGAPGGLVQDHEVRNLDSQLVFGAYHKGEFTVGIQGGEQGSILDLGTESGLRERFGYQDTVPSRQGFASIHVRDGHFVIRKEADSSQGQAFPEADAIFGTSTPGDHAPVALDHVYVVRIQDRHEPSELLVKLHVIGFQAEQSATVRWEKLTR